MLKNKYRNVIWIISLIMLLTCFISCDKGKTSSKKTNETLDKGIIIEAKERIPTKSVNGVSVLKLYKIDTANITYDWFYIDGEYSGKDKTNKLFIYVDEQEYPFLNVWIKAVEYLKTRADDGKAYDYSSSAPDKTTLAEWDANNFEKELQEISVKISVDGNDYIVHGFSERPFLTEYNDYQLSYTFEISPVGKSVVD